MKLTPASSLPIWVGFRYYRARSTNGFVSLVSVVSFLGLVLGMMAMIVVVSVMNGFDLELRERILGAVPHVVVQGSFEPGASLDNYPVTAVSEFREADVLLVTGTGSHLLKLYGVRPQDASGNAVLANAMTRGQFVALEGERLELVLGAAIARRFGLRIGESISLVVPRISGAGETLKPRLVAAQLVGTFSVGSEMDYRLGVMSLEDLSRVLPGPVNTRITLRDLFIAPALTADLSRQGFVVTDWTQQFGDFFQTVKMEKVMMFILLSFVVAVASFGIVSGLTMLVAGKRRDIAVLRTMGMGQASVLSIFLVQGLGIGLAGVLVGLALGLPLAFYAPQVMGYVESVSGFSIVAGTYFDQIPVDVRWPDVLAVALVGTVISFLATLYPSWRAAQLNPAEVLRYE